MITYAELKELFDYRDGNLYWKIKPSKKINIGDKAGFISKTTGYYRIGLFGKIYQLHRLIYLYHHGYLPKLIDHIDQNKTNNKIGNLREATKSQNTINSKIRSTNKSGVTGVSWNNRGNKWEVYLAINGKKQSFGRYVDLELAELVSIEARNKYHKDFSCYR